MLLVFHEALTDSETFRCLHLSRRYTALYVGKHIFGLVGGDIDEIVGHTYLYLKEQFVRSSVPPPSGILHGTIIGAPLIFTLVIGNHCAFQASNFGILGHGNTSKILFVSF